VAAGDYGGRVMMPRYIRHIDKGKPAVIIKAKAILANYLIYLLTNRHNGFKVLETRKAGDCCLRCCVGMERNVNN
jgi:hypothetical protein